MPATIVDDVTEDLCLIAQSPEQMQVAQKSLAEWFRAKVALCEKDADELAECAVACEAAGGKSELLKKQAKLAHGRMVYYEKCLMAIEAGYCLVPNFPCDVFAVRTTKDKPARLQSGWKSAVRDETGQELPVGVGEFKDATPVISSKSVQTVRGNGEPQTVREWFASGFQSEIEFPVSIRKPAIMSAAANAIAGKLFDELGIAVDSAVNAGRKAKGDPILLGRILTRDDKGRQQVRTFLIAWWIDTREL